MGNRQIFVDAIIRAAGLPYIFGSNGPDSFDCSGLIVACMREIWPGYGDVTAAGLHDKYKSMMITPDGIQPGCLLFYQGFGHVVACIRRLDNGILVLQGANGGTPLCSNIEKAYESHALVEPQYARIINGQYHGWWQTGYCGAVDPFKDEI